MSDFAALAQALVKLAKESGASEALDKILNQRTTRCFFSRQQGRYGDSLKSKVDVDFVASLERKNDCHTISNKTFDFTKNTIQQLIKDGYEETREQMKQILKQAERQTD